MSSKFHWSACNRFLFPFFSALLKSWNARFYSLEDGRSLCLECMESAIMDTGDCQPLYHSIRDFYEGMNMRLDQQIPMLLVERQALNEAIVGEKNVINELLVYVCVCVCLCVYLYFMEFLWFWSGSFQGLHHMPETRGLCLSEEQTVTSVCNQKFVRGFTLLNLKIVNKGIDMLFRLEKGRELAVTDL